MQTQEQDLSRPASQPGPRARRRSDWLHLLSRRSLILGSTALVARLAVVGISLADPDALHRRTLLTMVAASALVGGAALISLTADIRRAARAAGSAGYGRGYAECFEDLHGGEPDSGADVIDLAARRPRRRRPTAREADSEPALLPAPAARRQLVAFAVLALLMCAVVLSALWQPADKAEGRRPLVTPPATAPPSTAPTAGASPTPSSGTGGGKSAQPGQPAGHQTTTQPSTAAAVKTPSTGPVDDGTYRVGVDIAPGTWSSGGAINLTLGCSYSINGGKSVKVPLSVGAVSVHLHDGDVFATGGCSAWSRSGQ